MPLSDEEFNDLLQKRLVATDSDTPEDEDAELLSEEDEADLAIMREALGNYKAETLVWAEKRSSTMLSPQLGAAAALWERAPRWALAGVFAAACAVAAVTFTHVSASVPAAVAISAPDAQVLAADNQLLSSVDDALARNSSTPSEQELGLSPTDLSTGAHDTQDHRRTQNSLN